MSKWNTLHARARPEECAKQGIAIAHVCSAHRPFCTLRPFPPNSTWLHMAHLLVLKGLALLDLDHEAAIIDGIPEGYLRSGAPMERICSRF